MSPGAVAAVDLGATSGRVVLGRVSGHGGGRPKTVTLEDVHRFPNRPVRTPDGLHWNILELYQQVLVGLGKAAAAEPGLLSVGIDSWAIDYALIRGGRMVGTPYHYRDERTTRGIPAVHDIVDPTDLYAANGLQFLPFTSIFQLATDQQDGMLDEATTMLLVPDLIAYWLTGQMRAERTNASTTGLLDIAHRRWNTDLATCLGLSPNLLPSLIDPGQRIGGVTGDIAAALGVTDLDVVAVGSHDTASAVAATPLVAQDAAYISSGTWALIGCERAEPILTEESRAANFTNELGVDNRVRYLRNVMGMWVLNECVNAWSRMDPTVSLESLLVGARRAGRWAVFDVDDPVLLPAGDMPSRVYRLLVREGFADPTPAEVVRSILESLAAVYAATVSELEQLTGTTIRHVHIVGGGSQNRLLCQLIADRAKRVVIAGPVEATAMGNVLVQARSAGLLTGDLTSLRSVAAASAATSQYEPHPTLTGVRGQV